MADILDIPELRKRISRLSVEEYHRLGEFNEKGRRTELIRGIVLEKMSKSPLHRTVCSLLFKMIFSQLPEGYAVWKEEPLTLADSEPEPDLCVTRGDELAYRDEHPHTAELVIEVAATSPVLDRESASLYAEAGVKEYWIVLASAKAVELFRDPVRRLYREKATFVPGDIITSSSVAGLRVSVSDISR